MINSKRPEIVGAESGLVLFLFPADYKCMIFPFYVYFIYGLYYIQ